MKDENLTALLDALSQCQIRILMWTGVLAAMVYSLNSEKPVIPDFGESNFFPRAAMVLAVFSAGFYVLNRQLLSALGYLDAVRTIIERDEELGAALSRQHDYTLEHVYRDRRICAFILGVYYLILLSPFE